MDFCGEEWLRKLTNLKVKYKSVPLNVSSTSPSCRKNKAAEQYKSRRESNELQAIRPFKPIIFSKCVRIIGFRPKIN